ncbi:CAP domain [Arabidopsis suecica]|uniref:Pathogenesis-related protein 1 n=1 Tax=Arabidopsis suecica TaxID=45249 RepID=A0A8T2DSZ9_ARASU|nr:CAP domain [Arabidopsis suecica]
MKMFKSPQTLILSVIVLFLAFAVPLKAQDQPQDYLDEHNRARTQVGVPPMKWHAGAEQYAWNYAQQRKGDCSLTHSNSNGLYGENLAWSGGALSGAAAVKLWVNEKSDYIYASNTCSDGKQCGHYTQVVWRTSEWVGCAKVKCDNGGTFVTCNYYPPGNYRGRWPY